MLNTQNYSLNLPERSDQYNIDDYNENTEQIDAVLHNEEQARIEGDNAIMDEIKPITKEQIDNLLNFSPESAVELNGIRQAVDGTVYPTAGEAVRAQVTQLNERINELQSALDKLGLSVVNGELCVTYTKET